MSTPAAGPPTVDAAEPSSGSVGLWVGTYPAEGPDGQAGTGEGIWRVELDPATGGLTGRQVVTTPAPSFLAASTDGRTLYAVGETSSGTVSAFAVSPDGLELRASVGSGGSAPCHLLLHPRGRALYVTNYTSGTVGVLTLDPDGGFSTEVLAAGGPLQTFEHPGPPEVGVVADRQDGPHAHSSLLAPGGEHLLVADLGTDELRRFRVGTDGLLEEAGVAAVLPAGTGPRHLAVGPGDHLYVVGELAVTVHVLAWDRATGLAEPVGVLPAWAGAEQSASEQATTEQGTTEQGTAVLPAHLETSGDRVLVSVRGADVVACFAVRDDGARLEHTGDVPVGGRWPRHFAVVGTGPGRRVVAALQESGRLAALPWPSSLPGGIEGAVGVEGAPGVGGAGSVGSLVGGDGLALPYPACVVPVVEPGPAER